MLDSFQKQILTRDSEQGWSSPMVSVEEMMLGWSMEEHKRLEPQVKLHALSLARARCLVGGAQIIRCVQRSS